MYQGLSEITDIYRSFDSTDLHQSLEIKGWYTSDDLISENLVDQLSSYFNSIYGARDFTCAKVGTHKSLQTQVRVANTFWIDEWQDEPLKELSTVFTQLMRSVNSTFFLSMKRWESQFASYPKDGFYKKHLDQLRGENHRQLTLILYLNDCHHGGELVIYDRDNKMKIDATISPKKGTVVMFFSGQIYHEVLPVLEPRYSLTTWFRDDLEYILS